MRGSREAMMKVHRLTQGFLVAFALVVAVAPVSGEVVSVTGTPEQWGGITLTFVGPESAEDATPNPFTDYRLTVEFSHPDLAESVCVPGHFAADGNAAETGATSGDCWRVHFSPQQAGMWRWQARFKTGEGVALSSDPNSGERVSGVDGSTGTIKVDPSTATAYDLRQRGLLKHAGLRLLRFAGDGSHFIKTGAGSPETLLGYADFDGTYRDLETSHEPPAPRDAIPLPSLDEGLHRYDPHVSDWRAGDPTWRGGRGKGLIGGINYLSSVGVNSLYFLTMNVNGDGRNVWPWTSPAETKRFDCSKLDQW
ncbi:MAG: DUF5060 domain-containing protein, partial [Planctomycetota bacterium]